MQKEENEKLEKTEAENEGKIKASIYESTDKKDGGGTIRTRIFCFETNEPIWDEQEKV